MITSSWFGCLKKMIAQKKGSYKFFLDQERRWRVIAYCLIKWKEL